VTNSRRGWLSAALAILTLTVLLPLTTFVVAVWLLGWQLQSVQSGSMQPTYPVGSLLVVEALDASRVEPGMPIVFEDPELPGRLVAHRVVSEVPGDQRMFTTQGDANANRDPFPVPARLIRGHVLWHINGLGSVLDWLQWPRSFVLLVVLPGTLLVIGETRSWMMRKRAARVEGGVATTRRLSAIGPVDPGRPG
jgi:signal peptidase